MEGATQLKYLGRSLDQPDNDRVEIFWNIRSTQKVWVRMGKVLRWEGAYTHVLEIFYWAVVQVFLLFGSELWDMSEKMTMKMEGTYIIFLR